jgi:LemA protein
MALPFFGCFGLILLIVIVVAVMAVAIYNRLVVLRNRVDNGWSQIDVQLKRRYDLIPNLVETVKGYRDFEASTLEKVVQARSAAMGAQTVQEQSAAENQLTGALKSLFAVAEAYPDLKASGNFMDLQAQLTDTEGKIAYARQFYNDTVMTYNTATQTFPNSLLAGVFGFGQREYFEIETEAKEPVKVQF